MSSIFPISFSLFIVANWMSRASLASTSLLVLFSASTRNSLSFWSRTSRSFSSLTRLLLSNSISSIFCVLSSLSRSISFCFNTSSCFTLTSANDWLYKFNASAWSFSYSRLVFSISNTKTNLVSSISFCLNSSVLLWSFSISASFSRFSLMKLLRYTEDCSSSNLCDLRNNTKSLSASLRNFSMSLRCCFTERWSLSSIARWRCFSLTAILWSADVRILSCFVSYSNFFASIFSSISANSSS